MAVTLRSFHELQMCLVIRFYALKNTKRLKDPVVAFVFLPTLQFLSYKRTLCKNVVFNAFTILTATV